MQLKQGTYCPLIKKDCIELKCAWFVSLRGTDRNTGKDVDEYMCAMTSLPLLLCENSAVNRETGAAVESFRNEMVKTNNATNNLMLTAVRTKLMEIE